MPNAKRTTAGTAKDLPAAAAAILAVNPLVAKAWTDVMSESARFMTERLQRDLDLQKDLMACKSPPELMEVQSDFFRSAVDQYVTEIARYMDLSASAIQSIADEATATHKSERDDIPV